jgi:hypothetical protein
MYITGEMCYTNSERSYIIITFYNVSVPNYLPPGSVNNVTLSYTYVIFAGSNRTTFELN